MEYYFGGIKSGKMQYSPCGLAAKHFWQEIPDHNKNVILHEYVIMPNHMHGIIELVGPPPATARILSCGINNTRSAIQ